MGDQVQFNPDAIRSRIDELTELQRNCHDDVVLSTSNEEELLKECVGQLQGKINEIIGEYSDVSSLEVEDFDTYLENLKGELSAVEAENDKVSDEVGNLMRGYLEDSIQLESSIEGLNESLEFIESQGLEAKRADAHPECSHQAEQRLHLTGAHAGFKFKILEINNQIEKRRETLKSLKDLDCSLKRYEGVLKVEDALTGLKVIEYEGAHIRLSLITYIPEIERSEQNHELAIELLDGTLEMKNAEIFPNDVYIGEIIDVAKSFRQQFSLFPLPEKRTSLEWFVRRVQDRIVLSTLRKVSVKAASKSRHSVEYVDRDEMIVAHMVGGFDAFIKVSQGWPIASSALKLLSLKSSSQYSKEYSLSFLCKVEEMANSLDEQVCQNVSTYLDAVEEILKQRMRVELQSDGSNDK